MNDLDNDFGNEGTADASRLSGLSLSKPRTSTINRRYSALVRSLRFILPLIALVMTVIVLTWDEAGQRVKPMEKEELIPASENIQNELLKPVFNSVDSKNQPYSVTADRATQNRDNPDLVELQNPMADMATSDGGKIGAKASTGLYQQKEQKLNLEGDVVLTHSNGYTLKTQELRVDVVAQRAYSGRDVTMSGPAGTLDATGLEADTSTGSLVFTGPAKVVLYSDGSLLSTGKTPAKEKTP